MNSANYTLSGAVVRSLSIKTVEFFVYTGIFVAGNIALPALCHSIPNGGPMLLPIYFFTLIAGYGFGLWAGLATALLSPVANHILTGMPTLTMLPIILTKSLFLALIASVVARLHKLSLVGVALVVLGYQIAGGGIEWILSGSLETALADFRVGLPGILLQIVGGYAILRLLVSR